MEKEQQIREFADRHHLVYEVHPHQGRHNSRLYAPQSTCYDVTLCILPAHPEQIPGLDLRRALRAGQHFQLFAGPMANLIDLYGTREQGLEALMTQADEGGSYSDYASWDSREELLDMGVEEDVIRALWKYSKGIYKGLLALLGEDAYWELHHIVFS